MPDWLQHRAHALPGATAAVLADGTVLTYAELDARVAGLAAVLETRGIAAGHHVALLALNSLEFVEAVHAVTRLDAVLVPLNARLTPAELAYQLENCRARLLLTHAPTAALAREAAASTETPIFELGGETTGPGGTQPGRSVRTHDPAAPHSIIYTSGTTGRPKGAILTYENFAASAAASAYNMGVLPGDRWLACMPLFHVGGLSIVLRSAIYGTAVVIHPAFDEHAVNRALRDEGVSLLSVVPTMLQRMLDAGALPYPPSVRGVLVGGGPVTRDLLARALERGLPVLQTYGLSEAASQVTTLSPGDALTHTGSAGKPLLCTRLRIDAPAGEPGEILVSGVTVTAGYLGNPEATARALRDGWLHTGDIGRLDPEGFLYVLDRRDDLIVTGGENVYPAEVEGHLLQHPAVEAAAVVGIPDARWGQAVAAALVLRTPSEDPAATFDAYLRERIAPYKLPRRYLVTGSLPATASGKIQRHIVRTLFT
ncbi:MAG: o-succinylbenzoate--CoA ligase [Dehalococcoidia bacterium]|nr:o-succinylbenzoate--CoA ligase [Dehalococcoidia bacterium]